MNKRLIQATLTALLALVGSASAGTRVSLSGTTWLIDGRPTNPGTIAEGLLMNVRMVNATFEDRNKPNFDAEANADRFITKIPDYAAQGLNAFTLCLQGGTPGYEGAVISAFELDGSLRETYLNRVERVIRACDRHGIVVILGCFYQRQDQRFKDEDAIRAALTNAVRWICERGFSNVVLEVANEYGHSGYDYPILRNDSGQVELIHLVKKTAPQLLVSTSGLGGGSVGASVARASDFLLIHYNNTPVEDIPKKIAALKKYGKPIVCNEDAKLGAEGAMALELSVRNGAAWGFMHETRNQHHPFDFHRVEDDAVVYAKLRLLRMPEFDDGYFPPTESNGGWRFVKTPEEIRRVGGMDPVKIDSLREWLLASDEQQRPFAAEVIRRGRIVLEIEKGLNSKTDTGTGGIASCAKAICATVLAVASEESQQGRTPKKMSFNDPGTDLEYSTHGIYHASLVCEGVTGKPYDQFAIEHSFKPIGIENWRFEFFEGNKRHGRHPSHSLGLSARDMARIGYCMLRGGRWNDRQVVPQWFVDESAAPTQSIKGIKTFGREAQSYSHGWELPARLTRGLGKGIPTDARFKPGTGCQLIAFVPSLDLVVVRMTGSAGGEFDYEEYLRRACAAVLN